MSDKECLCVKCAKLVGKTCCQNMEIYVTPGDTARITEYTGQSGFYEFLKPSPAYSEQEDDPIWKAYVFRSDGTRRILKRTDEGNCIFLTLNGCRLSTEIRPLLCRLYPYTFDADNIYLKFEEGCPVNLLKPKQSLAEALNISLEKAIEWHYILYTEILLEESYESRINL